MSKMQGMSDDQIRKAIETYKAKLPLIPDGEDKDLCLVGLENFQNELIRRAQKKSESQPSAKPEQLPDMEQCREMENKREWIKERQAHAQVEREKFEATMGKAGLMGNDKPSQLFQKSLERIEGIKTVKAPAFVAPDELINVTLENLDGEEYIRTHTKAQVRALARKYFSNIHKSWMGKEKKMGVGFKNLLAYVVAWKEFDSKMPSLRDVLPDYDRYSKGGDDKQPSEAFKVAQELYNKIAELIK